MSENEEKQKETEGLILDPNANLADQLVKHELKIIQKRHHDYLNSLARPKPAAKPPEPPPAAS